MLRNTGYDRTVGVTQSTFLISYMRRSSRFHDDSVGWSLQGNILQSWFVRPLREVGKVLERSLLRFDFTTAACVSMCLCVAP